jgi:NADPH-dependent curcumin reductase CurA
LPVGGVDIFLDSVGGSMYNTVLSNHMNLGGRICIFGNLSLYNNHSNMEMVPSNDLIISLKVI